MAGAVAAVQKCRSAQKLRPWVLPDLTVGVKPEVQVLDFLSYKMLATFRHHKGHGVSQTLASAALHQLLPFGGR